MSRKIATPTAVFDACDQLEATDKPWNRDDVRLAVGGGGWTVIDPLIQAWRELKPVKALAPATPTVLLHQMAQTLETHFSEFMEDVERRERERCEVFEKTVAELSERVATLDNELVEKNIELETLQGQCERISDQLEEKSKSLLNAQHQQSTLQSENDELQGQNARLDKQLQETLDTHTIEIRSLQSKFEQKLSANTVAYKGDMEKQKKELLQANEQSEDRLMRLIDRERNDGKQTAEKLTQQLTESREKGQTAREQSIEKQAHAQQLQNKIDDLDKTSNKLRENLELEKLRYTTLDTEYQTYRRTHETRFDELQATLLDLKKRIKT